MTSGPEAVGRTGTRGTAAVATARATTRPRLDPRPRVTAQHDVGRSVDIGAAGVVLARYVYVPDDAQLESPRPYLHPVRTRGGDLVTAFRPHDHVWHKGIAWSLPVVGEHNFWGGPTYVHGQGYVQLDNDGSMDHQALDVLAVGTTHGTADSSAGGADRVDLAHTLAWHTQAGAHVVDERRELAVVVPRDRDNVWFLTFATTMTNVSPDDLPLGSPTTRGRDNAGYGGLFWRGPRSFTGGTLLAPGFTGGEEARGTRAPWMGFVGQHDDVGRASSVVMVDAADNPQHPPQWFARTELFGCLAPAPFFSTEVPFGPGDTLRFRYAVAVADGAVDETGAAALADLGRGILGA
ncbi:hypothetical protein Cch01nite_21680 [Cellulomonas chitinilytica]|uniref:Oxidoreductase n=1 Tax=Cellulomonas chitinilytica TaxID=398759 RepID=A0A919U2T2_9CELL|nr:PmoA family protein [Cellulomonas chitinilytica]GIG21444.1 hypothetical protein Cch01nite_21680 [Cellulomonas chitinilytica]